MTASGSRLSALGVELTLTLIVRLQYHAALDASPLTVLTVPTLPAFLPMSLTRT